MEFVDISLCDLISCQHRVWLLDGTGPNYETFQDSASKQWEHALVLAVSNIRDGAGSGGNGSPDQENLNHQDAGSRDAGPCIYHRPVLLSEVIEHLVVRRDGVYVDATLGEGGHSAAILSATAPGGRVLGIDRDPRMLTVADRRLADFAPSGDGSHPSFHGQNAGIGPGFQRFTSVHAGYDGLIDAAASRGIHAADGVLMDLGISSRQLEAPGYGFSFYSDAPLDMRFDPSSPLTAHQVVNTYTEEELTSLLRENGEEPRARQIARVIVRYRPIGDAATLAEVVTAAAGGRGRRRVHPATRTFQALRITVNNELDVLREGLRSAVRLLASGGRLVVIGYHSLEDRIVKQFLARESATCVCPPEIPVCVCGHEPTVRILNRRVIRPSLREVNDNPRSRSARMRVAERL